MTLGRSSPSLGTLYGETVQTPCKAPYRFLRVGIKIHYYDLQKKLKGFFYYQSRQKNIVIDHNVNGILERILVAHELGHAVLHTKIAMMHGFQEMEVFDDRSIEENEANFFAAELLLEDGKVLECLSEHTFFETAKMLYVPAALLDYKFSLLHEKGELVNSMYIRKADFLKEDLHAYDNDIGYALNGTHCNVHAVGGTFFHRIAQNHFRMSDIRPPGHNPE